MSKKYGYMAVISADTTGLITALKDVEQAQKLLTLRTKAISEGLKIDPQNVELAKQKYEAFTEQVDLTATKLKVLKEVEDKAKAARQDYKMSKSQYAYFVKQLADTENKLKTQEIQLNTAKKQFTTLAQAASGVTADINNAISETTDYAKNISNELKVINSGLKIDANTENLTQKYNLLSQAIADTSNQLQKLKVLETEVNSASEKGDITETQYKAYQREITNTESRLRQYENELKNTQKQMDKAGNATDDLKEDTKELKKEIGNAEKSAASFGDVFKANILSDVIMSGVRRLAEGFVDFARQGIELASSLSEVQNVVDVTFGQDAGVINEWSKNAAESFGLSELAAKQYTGTLGAMLKSQGVTTDSLVEMSTALTGLAGDIASFYNINIETAFEKIRSGISGETEPLKQLGINMNVANLEAFALAQGIEKAWKNMSQAEKAQLRYSYLLQQTADAQGDFVRTSDSYANQSRITELQLQNISAELGEKLLPAALEFKKVIIDTVPSAMDNIEGLINVLATLGEFFLKNSEATTTLITTLVSFKATIAIGNAISKAVAALQTLRTALQTQTAAQAAANAVAAANPYVLVASAIATVVAAVASYVIQLDNAVNSEKEIAKAAEEIIKNSEKEAQITKVKAERYRELYNEYKETGVASAELKQLAEELQELSPGTIKLIDEETNAYLELDESINKVINSIRAKGIEDARSDSLTKYYENIAEYESKIADATIKYYKEIEKAGFSDEMLAEFQKENLGKYFDYLDISKADTLENFDYIHSQIEAFLRIEDERNTAIDKYNAKIKKQEDSINTVNKAYDDMLKKQNLVYSSENVSASGDNIAANEEAKGKKRLEIQQQTNEEYSKKQQNFEEELEAELKAIEERYNKHQIVDSQGNKDEARYMAERKKYLEEHVNESSEIWWKYYDEIADYEKKSAEASRTASEKAAEEAEKAKVEYVKSAWDKITRLRERGTIDEDKEYELKAQIVKQYCDENEDTWNEYYDWLYDFVKTREEELTEEQVDAWEKNSKELAESLSDRYEDLVDRKKKVKQDLLNIDLSETVKDKDGKDITVLTDLNEEIKKINKYKNSLQKLKKTGASESLIAEIQNLSYDDGQRQRFIDVLLGLSESKRQLYYSDWERMQEAAEKASDAEIADDLKELNDSTAKAVDNIFGNIPATAYEQGVETARSYIQGIIDSMDGISNAPFIQDLLNYQSTGGAGNGQNPQTISLDTPIIINLNDKQYIETTLSDLLTRGITTGGNNFNL